MAPLTGNWFAVLRKRVQYQVSAHPPSLLQFPAKILMFTPKNAHPIDLVRSFQMQRDARLVYSYTENGVI